MNYPDARLALWLTLDAVTGIGPVTAARLLERAGGSIETLFQSDEAQLQSRSNNCAGPRRWLSRAWLGPICLTISLFRKITRFIHPCYGKFPRPPCCSTVVAILLRYRDPSWQWWGHAILPMQVKIMPPAFVASWLDAG